MTAPASDDDPPPAILGLRGWPALYALVIAGLVACVALLSLITRMYR